MDYGIAGSHGDRKSGFRQMEAGGGAALLAYHADECTHRQVQPGSQAVVEKRAATVGKGASAGFSEETSACEAFYARNQLIERIRKDKW